MMRTTAHTCAKRQKYYFEVHRVTGMNNRFTMLYPYMALDVIVYTPALVPAY